MIQVGEEILNKAFKSGLAGDVILFLLKRVCDIEKLTNIFTDQNGT